MTTRPLIPAPSFSLLLTDLGNRPDPERLLRQFMPPRRFRYKRFSTFRPDPRHPSQREARDDLRALAVSLRRSTGATRWSSRMLGRRPTPRNVYLDGGFGVGKTHLLAALWNAAPGPKAYLTFDELTYTLGLLGVRKARGAFRGHRLVAVDEWELDDPGNLKLALAFLRGVLGDGVRVATTSNTVPDELGRGRFSQKEFTAEVEELAGAFEVLRLTGEDFRQRRFEARSGRGHFSDQAAMRNLSEGPGVVGVRFAQLLDALSRLHPIRYAELADRIEALLVYGVERIDRLPEALRWVHWIDVLYDRAVPVAASGDVELGEMFPAGFMIGPYGKKFGRCLSRMEEMLGEGGSARRPVG